MVCLPIQGSGRVVAVLVILAAWQSVASAQPAGGGPGGGQDPAQMFRQLDTNKDGELSMDDATDQNRGFLRTVFEFAGKGDSDTISREEFNETVDKFRRQQGNGGGSRGNGGGQPGNGGRPPRPNGDRPPMPPPPPPGGQVGPGNRQITRDDLRRLVENFDEYDANGNGTLDLGEMAAALELGGSGGPGGRPPADGGNAGRAPAGRNMGNSGRNSANPGRSFGNSGNRSNSGSGGSGGSGGGGSTKSSPRNSSSGNSGSSSRSGRAGGGGNSLAGTWRGWVVDGRGENPNAGHMEMELRIEGNRMVARELGANRPQDGMGEGTYVVTGSGNSGELDATGTTGQYDGNEYLGIYEIDGDTLRWCVGNRGRPRPRDFETGRGNYLMILRKQ